MSKPDWCPQEVWDCVERLPIISENFDDGDMMIVARAILAAEKRGEEREREACAALVDALPIGNLVSTNETDLHRLWRYAGSAQAGAICAAIRARSTP